jgi:hypothetical protein
MRLQACPAAAGLSPAATVLKVQAKEEIVLLYLETFVNTHHVIIL